MASPRRIGITTTVPLEPFFASGARPVDLNNLFIRSAVPVELVEEAQVRGFPRNICTWIKGLHSASSKVDAVVGVVRGDCSNTESLLETLSREGMPVHPFSYPFNRSRDDLVGEVEELCRFLGCSYNEAKGEANRVQELRGLASHVDELRWKELKVTAEEAHTALVSTSDMDPGPTAWELRIKELIARAEEREPQDDGIRLAYIGVPPIITDFFPRIESLGGRTVFFEVQRQFAMPSGSGDWIDRYLNYTYPYDISSRVADIREQTARRGVDGIIHYVQSFCHRQIDDIIFRKELDLPLLTVEGNLPGPMDERTLIRIEAFLDILKEGG
ncbi:MAG: 2-hydroxyacyl-CoA dehydratase family protein [Thermoplasmatota archaeon]